MTPFAPIKVIGARQSVELTAIVDTGFEGFVCLPIRVAVPLGLELTGEQMVELGDGSQRSELFFAGEVEFFNTRREVQILLTQSVDALIGTELLNHYRASINFPGGQVKVSAGGKQGMKPKRKPKG